MHKPAGIVQLNGNVVAVYTLVGRTSGAVTWQPRKGGWRHPYVLGRGVLQDDCQIVGIRLRWGVAGAVKPGECRVELVEAA